MEILGKQWKKLMELCSYTGYLRLWAEAEEVLWDPIYSISPNMDSRNGLASLGRPYGKHREVVSLAFPGWKQAWGSGPVHSKAAHGGEHACLVVAAGDSLVSQRVPNVTLKPRTQ